MNADASLAQYFTISDYCDQNFQENYNFSILNYNIRSFFKNQTAIESLIDMLNTDLDILFVSETWVNKTNYNSCNIQGFSGSHTYRTEARSGGISVFTRNKHKAEKIDCLSRCNELIESCVVQVVIGKLSVVAVGVYRPHSGTIDAFTAELANILSSPIIRKSFVILAGDMNINMNDTISGSVQNYIAHLTSLNLFSMVNNYTRFSNDDTDLVQHRSAIDHIWINEVVPNISAIIHYDATDHRPCILHMKFDENIIGPADMKKISFRPYRDDYFEFLCWQISCVNWDSILDYNDVNASSLKFVETIDNLYCFSFPLKHKFVSEKRLKSPWLNPYVKQKINAKSRSLKLFKSGIISAQSYHSIRNSVNRIVKKAKNQYYEHSFDLNRNNSSKSWNLMHNLMGKQVKKSVVDSIKVNDIQVSDSKNIADEFIDYFADIGEQLDSVLGDSSLDPCENIVRNIRSFFLYPVNTNEIEKIIKKLKLTKNSVHSLPVKLFKALSPLLTIPLTKLINASFSTGVFPTVFKIARVTPLFKSGDKEKISNYRPISSLHYLSKIFERCMVNRLVSFFNKYNLFSKNQFGFLKGKSTADALIHLSEIIYEGLDAKKHNLNILIDLKKAFDTVNHVILLKKLSLYGIRGISLNWFESYLKNRECYTCINNHNSKTRFLNIGVPQGSILGPILFLIYINDLPNVMNSGSTTLYADDTTLSFSGQNASSLVENVNSELEKVERWTISNRLTINPSKTELLIVTKKKSDVDNLQNIQLGSEIIQPVNSCKFLGTYLDDNLDFNENINYILKKIARNGGILYRIRDSLNQTACLNFYNSFILPFLTYNIICWGSTTANHTTPLFLQQKRIIRTMTKSIYLEHTSALFKNLGLLKLNDIYRFELLKFMYKKRNDPRFMVLHDRNTRHRHLLVPTPRRLTKTEQSVFTSGPNEWNSLPDDIRNSNTFCIFVRSLKSYFLDSY